ncbi:MAG: TIGR04283 family arsenosugar biosynthesis glycosyltransferase [Mariprofundaceae bacterium]
MEKLSIAVIVPVLNEMKRLPDLMQMLAELNADEVMIVDGESTDGSADWLSGEISKRASESGFVYCTSSPGRALQLNSGAELCHSEILLFLHADTGIHAASLERIRDVMQNPEVVGGRFDLNLTGTGLVFRLIEFMINLRSRLSRISTGDQAMFVRREVFERLGRFPNQSLMEDIELSKRLKREGSVVCLRERITTSSRRWEKHGVMRTIVLMWKLRFLYWTGVSPGRLEKMYRHAR